MISALLSACQSPREALQQLADAHGRHVEVLPGYGFPLLIVAPRAAEKTTRLRIYLEGDGHAWATATQPSLDPSPHNLLVARLAVDDPTPNAYLARPCQFVMANACETALWTHRRFSQAVLTRLSQALEQLKQRYGNREFERVGYSGGAALALLLGSVRKALRRRPGKAKTAEEAECTGVHEHSEGVFNAAWASIEAFRTEPSGSAH